MPDTQFPNLENRHHPAPEEFHILKAAPTKDFTDILFLASQVAQCSAGALKIVENGRAWIKTSVGIPMDDIPKNETLWREVLEKKEILIVPNLSEVEDYSENGFGELTFYAGVPLITTAGQALGVMMLFDEEKKDLSLDQKNALNLVVQQILNLVAFRKQTNEFQRVRQNLEQRYKDLEKFASVVSHDIKSPLANIISLTELLKEENKDNFNEETSQYIDFLSQASYSLRSYVDGLLVFYRSDRILEREEEDVDLKSFFEEVTKLYAVKPDVEINYPEYGRLERVNKAALTQIFFNLISNGLKYNNKEQRRVDITFEPTDEFYKFEVIDNGNGIPRESFRKIFELFSTLDLNDRDGNPGSGIGLATVQKLVHHMGGDISIESEPGRGSTFKLQIKR